MTHAPKTWRVQVGTRRRWWQRRRWSDYPVGWPEPADLSDPDQARYWYHALALSAPGHRKRLVDPDGNVVATD
jgi:hypothetical protein